MKDYLKEELSKEEKLILLGLIWKVSRKYRAKLFKNQNKYCEMIDDFDLIVEDNYTYYDYSLKIDIQYLKPLTDEQKCDIVMKTDTLLRENCAFELIRTLTFNEKLVFFLFTIEEYKINVIAKLLNISERAIFKRRISIKNKINQMKGGM